jgi:FKBP-type peptidyl-prolyl cis-trans isomerase FklB
MIASSRAAALCGFFAVCLVAVALAGTTPEGKSWLAMKAKEDGVISTGSGLLYKVLKSGPTGAKQPKIDTPCECHYKGTLIDGREFDSSYSRGMPATFAPNQVIKGWTEAMQMMKEGDHWELYIPSELAYGDANRSARSFFLSVVHIFSDTARRGGLITPGAVLVFELEMLKVKN